MQKKRRSFQIAEVIREIVSRCLIDSPDPRFELVTVTSVVVSNDNKHAKIYWINSITKFSETEINNALNKARGFFKKQISLAMQVRSLPDLHFYFDDTTKTMQEVNLLLNKIKKNED